jgi:hypothetical protein
MKKILFTSAALFAALFMYGQARDASFMVDNENRNAVTINISQPEKITQDALQQRLQRSGLKSKVRNGVMSFKGVVFSEISPDKLDIYTKVEKAPNNGSMVYMAVSRGYNNFTNSAADSALTQNVKTFLQSFVRDADYHSADVDISSQLSDINKDEKAYQKLLDEQRDLQKEKSTIENRLIEIQTELNTKGENLKKKKSGMEDAKVKRGNINSQ